MASRSLSPLLISLLQKTKLFFTCFLLVDSEISNQSKTDGGTDERSLSTRHCLIQRQPIATAAAAAGQYICIFYCRPQYFVLQLGNTQSK